MPGTDCEPISKQEIWAHVQVLTSILQQSVFNQQLYLGLCYSWGVHPSFDASSPFVDVATPEVPCEEQANKAQPSSDKKTLVPTHVPWSDVRDSVSEVVRNIGSNVPRIVNFQSWNSRKGNLQSHCRRFHKHGLCKYGDACYYKHERLVEEPATIVLEYLTSRVEETLPSPRESDISSSRIQHESEELAGKQISADEEFADKELAFAEIEEVPVHMHSKEKGPSVQLASTSSGNEVTSQRGVVVAAEEVSSQHQGKHSEGFLDRGSSYFANITLMQLQKDLSALHLAPFSDNFLEQFAEAVRAEVETWSAFERLAKEMTSGTLSNGVFWKGWLVHKVNHSEHTCETPLDAYSEIVEEGEHVNDEFYSGGFVTVCDLKQQELNGLSGIVLHYDKEAARFAVRITRLCEGKLLKRCNLRPYRPNEHDICRTCNSIFNLNEFPICDCSTSSTHQDNTQNGGPSSERATRRC